MKITTYRLVLTDKFKDLPQERGMPSGSGAGSTGAGTVGDAGPRADPPAGVSTDACWQQAMILGGFLAIMYFLVIRPGQKQEKARRELIASIKKGDRVATSSGIHGSIESLDEKTVSVRVDRDVVLTIDRSAIGRVIPNEAPATS